MATFTLPAGAFPAVGANFLVSLPLNDTPEVWASDFVTALDALGFFVQDANQNLVSRDPQDLRDNAHNPDFDFIIQGGIGYLAINGKTTATDVIFNGDGWCNIFDVDTVIPCP